VRGEVLRLVVPVALLDGLFIPGYDLFQLECTSAPLKIGYTPPGRSSRC
jgi:hypothetical protein